MGKAGYETLPIKPDLIQKGHYFSVFQSNELEGKWSSEVPESPCLGPGRFAEGVQGTLFSWPWTANVEIRNSSNGFGSNFVRKPKIKTTLVKCFKVVCRFAS